MSEVPLYQVRDPRRLGGEPDVQTPPTGVEPGAFSQDAFSQDAFSCTRGTPDLELTPDV
ncbi:hypothetical protein T484DRAFT_1987452, partial [Baffinella frigidus]